MHAEDLERCEAEDRGLTSIETESQKAMRKSFDTLAAVREHFKEDSQSGSWFVFGMSLLSIDLSV